MLLLAVAAGVLAGCGTSTSQQVRAKVEQFAHAVSQGDAGTLCNQVLDTTLLEKFAQVGLSCNRAMDTFLSSVHDPTLAVGRVVVSGRRAEAIVLTGAKGQEGSLDAVELFNTSAGWRIYGLGQSVIPPAEGKVGTGRAGTGRGAGGNATGGTAAGNATGGTAPGRTTTTATTTTATTTTATTPAKARHHSSGGKRP